MAIQIGQFPRHQHAGDHAGQAEDRADRQVDAAGDDHRRHAEADDADEGEVAEDVEEIAGREEGVVANDR